MASMCIRIRGRTLADVLLSDGTNLNHTLVRDGWCWSYRKYVPGDTVLEGLEKGAREAKKELWVDPAPVPPWVYRNISRAAKSIFSPVAPNGIKNPTVFGNG